MAFGLIDSTYIDFAPGVDSDYLRGLSTRSGLKFTTIVGMVDSAMRGINEGVHPIVADLVFPTTRADAPVQRIGRKTVQRRAEYTVARPQRGEAKTFMLPIDDWDIAIGFTEDGLESASSDYITDELREMVEAFQRLHLQQTLERLFNPSEVPVGKGSSVLSPGFAGSGTGGNVFEGFFPDGTTIPNDYTHYAVTDAAGLGAAMTQLAKDAQRWHGRAYLDLVGSAEMIDAIAALPNGQFVEAGSALIRNAQGEREALVDPDTYVGVVNKVIRVKHPLGELTTPHLAVYRTYGRFNANNPLAWRYDTLAGKGREAWIRDRGMYPLGQANAMQRFGVGVFNRVGAWLLFMDESATEYAAPAFSL